MQRHELSEERGSAPPTRVLAKQPDAYQSILSYRVALNFNPSTFRSALGFPTERAAAQARNGTPLFTSAHTQNSSLRLLYCESPTLRRNISPPKSVSKRRPGKTAQVVGDKLREAYRFLRNVGEHYRTHTVISSQSPRKQEDKSK
jgi:hypothetical protein